MFMIDCSVVWNRGVYSEEDKGVLSSVDLIDLLTNTINPTLLIPHGIWEFGAS